MNRDSDESHAPEVLKVKKELRKVESTYNPPRGLVSRKSKSKAKERQPANLNAFTWGMR